MIRPRRALTGPQHYKTAQALLGNLRDEMAGSPGTPLRTPDQQTRMIAEAHVHATLAQTAVLAELLTTLPEGMPEHWANVLNPAPATT